MESNQSLRDRLAEINAQIALLEAERKVVQKKLQSATYPVLSLPFEVTSEIFLRCLPNLQDSEPIFNFSRYKLPTPLLLSQICRDWREIAFKTHRIWVIFRISVQVWTRDPVQCSRQLTKWAERAGTFPLSLMLERPETYVSSGTLPMTSIPILSLSNQWQNLDLRLLHSDLVSKQLQSGLHGRLSCLQTLKIRTRGLERIVIAFQIAPSLRRVVLDSAPPDLILLPWKQLTHFSGSRFTGADWLYVLRLTVSLFECKLVVIEPSLDGTELLPPRLALRVLHLKGNMRGMLQVLTLPSLVELDYNIHDSTQDHTNFVALLSRSTYLLRLSLHGGTFSRILDGFPFLPNLTVLEISPLILAGMSDFWRSLGPCGPATFLPKLESLALSLSQPVSFYGSLENISVMN
ncbi:hypothetical protein K438DRAFT_128834 [Mycena galopus ATCC 62051]|nr:hypothetical protein K438DRAFT_128834 [Mycena galopus ATCC 62051]